MEIEEEIYDFIKKIDWKLIYFKHYINKKGEYCSFRIIKKRKKLKDLIIKTN